MIGKKSNSYFEGRKRMERCITVHVRDLDFNVVDHGGSGEVIVCIHGLTANAYFFDSLASEWVKDYRVLSYDLRGRGNSSKPAAGYSLKEHAEDLVEILRALKLENVIVVGHSLGAMIASYFTAHYSRFVKKLILIDGGANLDERVISALTPSINRLDHQYESYQTFLSKMKETDFFKPWHQGLERYFNYDVHHMENGSVQPKVRKVTIEEELKNLLAAEITMLHEKINVPVLIFFAPDCLYDKEAFVISKQQCNELVSRYKNYELIEIPQSNHFSIAIHFAKEVAASTKTFIEQVCNLHATTGSYNSDNS